MSSDPNLRATVQQAAAALLQGLLGRAGGRTPIRVTEAAGDLACLVLVWRADAKLPTARGERAKLQASGGRVKCREDILTVLRAAGQPLSRKEVVRWLKDAGMKHGAGTVAKALADLTASGELMNLLDKRGYRLPEWPRRNQTPSLFA